MRSPHDNRFPIENRDWAMPTAQLNLVLNETKVMGGENLTAKLLIDSADPETIIHSLTAEVRGVGRTGWVNIHTDKIFETEKDYLNTRISLCPPNTPLPAGRHQFPLQVHIPDGAPSSYESQFGMIRYQIKVRMDANTEQASCTEVFPFVVICRSFFDDVPASCMSPIDYADEIDFTCCSLPFGTITIKVALPRTAFTVGELVEPIIRIKNRSRKGLKDCSVTLSMKTQFEATSRYEHVNEKKLSEQLIEMVNLGGVPGRSTQEFNRCTLRIPTGAPPTQNYMASGQPNIIAIYYVLKVTATPGIECEMPLIVTSGGYRDAQKNTAFQYHLQRQRKDALKDNESKINNNLIEYAFS
ncbi:unnamed protein product, partial [Mesorhabditis belari]|uniref:Arrestin C-terminal-like domain-containing protein n=1 Tax=Mesorhabditis belari TaxID=2138241 RepID=A0AAF3EBL1_9BILA